MSDSTISLPTTEQLRERARAAFDRIGVDVPTGTDLPARTPITGADL